MKQRTVLATVLATIAATGGCSSGSGSKEDREALLCIVNLVGCALNHAFRPSTTTSHAGGDGGEFRPWDSSLGERMDRGALVQTQAARGAEADIAVVSYDAQQRLVSLKVGVLDLSPGESGTRAVSGHPELDASKQAVVANPYRLGWSYQSFGAWDTASGPGVAQFGATSFGTPTAASGVPAFGTAMFTGKLSGFHVSAQGEKLLAAADLTVNVNFSARSLDLASTGTTVGAGVAAHNLDLSGTLTYSPGSTVFAGTLSNAGRTMSGPSTGRFYGPAAEELGGTFSVKSPATAEAFTGGYGGRR
jgi:hypothetical protein